MFLYNIYYGKIICCNTKYNELKGIKLINHHVGDFMNYELASRILEQIEEGVVILDSDRKIRYMNSSSKEMFGIDLGRGWDHPSSKVVRGDIVIFACNGIGVDRETLTFADFEKIGIDIEKIEIGDAVIALGTLGGKKGTGVYKTVHPGKMDRIVEFRHELNDGSGVFAEVNEISRTINVESRGKRFELDFQNFNCLTVVFDRDSQDLKFYQSPGYSRRKETAENLLKGRKFEGKGIHATSRDAEGEDVGILNPGKVCLDTVHKVLKGQNESISSSECSINTVSVSLSVFQNKNDLEEIEGCTMVINNISRVKALQRELTAAERRHDPFDKVIGSSSAIMKTMTIAGKISSSKSTVLLQGESGTGKGIFAKAIHESSPRRSKPFVAINMAAIPENLLESELFGYVGGAFTGAARGGKKGKFAVADGGTLFLDEIGDMNHSLQAKLLQALQENRIYPVGSLESVDIDVRIIAATNKSLDEEVKSGNFREDLYYRLNVINIEVPPLRVRKEDIRDIASSKLPLLNNRIGKRVSGIEEEVFNLFHSYDWPGNVRELENVLESAVNICEGVTIGVEDLPERFVESFSKTAVNEQSNLLSIKNASHEAEKRAIETALRISGGNRTRAAKMLKIGRTAFYNKMKRYNIKD
jgi:transcriptional regulator with PAS, ATPase and Fis domain